VRNWLSYIHTRARARAYTHTHTHTHTQGCRIICAILYRVPSIARKVSVRYELRRHQHCYRGQWKHSERKELRHYSRHTFLFRAVLTKIKKEMELTHVKFFLEILFNFISGLSIVRMFKNLLNNIIYQVI